MSQIAAKDPDEVTDSSYIGHSKYSFMTFVNQNISWQTKITDQALKVLALLSFICAIPTRAFLCVMTWGTFTANMKSEGVFSFQLVTVEAAGVP